MKNVMKAALIVPFLMAAVAWGQANASYSVEVGEKYRLDREPVGLYVVDFQISNNETGNTKSYTYRIYCPRKNLRDVSGSKWGPLRDAKKEDQAKFDGQPIMQQVLAEVCGKPDTSRRSALP